MNRIEMQTLLDKIVDEVVESGHPAADRLILFRDEFQKPTQDELALYRLSAALGSPAVHGTKEEGLAGGLVDLVLQRLEQAQTELASLRDPQAGRGYKETR